MKDRKNKPATVVVGIRMQSNTYEEILRVAQENDQSACATIRILLKDALERLSKGEIVGLR